MSELIRTSLLKYFNRLLEEVSELQNTHMCGDLTVNLAENGLVFKDAKKQRMVLVRYHDACKITLEFTDTLEDWTRTVIAIIREDETSAAEMIHRWMFIPEGFLFNVRSNGELPAYASCRSNGQTFRRTIGWVKTGEEKQCD